MIREDVTDWLIHFTKDISVKDVVDVYHKEVMVEGLETPNEELDLDYTNQLPFGISSLSAFEVLKNIIKECGIRYNYSFRNSVTTLYGGEPVVCFTEMPIHSLIQYAKLRSKNSNSTYGIAIKKIDAFKYGARPVIYGLSPNTVFEYLEKSDIKRVLKPTVLPIKEQFRLVPLILDKNVDWTHEREWRIKRRNDDNHLTYVNNGYNLEGIENFNLFEDDGHCQEVIVIVNTVEEANELYDIILALKDGSGNEYGISFNPKSIAILIIQNLENEDKVIRKIEDISSKAYLKVELEDLSQEELENLDALINRCINEVSKEATTEYLDKYALDKKINDFKGSSGFSSILTYQVRNKYLRGLLKLGIAFPIGSEYVIRAVGTHFHSQSINFNEYVAEKVCAELNKEIGNIFYVRSNID